MNPGIIGALGGQLTQQGFSVAEAVGLHVDVGEADGGFRGGRIIGVRVMVVRIILLRIVVVGIGGARIERQHLFVFGFGIREFLSPLMQQSRGKMGFGVLRRKLGSLAVSL